MAQFTLGAPTPGTFQTAIITFGRDGFTFTNTTAQGIRALFVTQPTYILGISLVLGPAASAAGTFQAGYTNDLTGALDSVLTTTNFGGTAKNNSATGGVIDLAIQSSGGTVTTAAGSADDTNPLLIPANSWIGFNANASVTAAGPKLMAVIVRYRCP